ncbi:hypothetical protein BKA69DRAFT_720494 [Paraphysoderma sedebokerense]|nr:hypothetical protein BKA69DRAFT_720494 [Paraphysoderma sedebokerense]
MKPCLRRLDNWLRLIIFNSILAILATNFMASDTTLTDGYGSSRIARGIIEDVEYVKYRFLAFFLLVPLILIPWQILSILLEIHRAARQELQRKRKLSSVSSTSLQVAAKLQYVFTPPVLKIYSIFADAVDPETLVPLARANTIRGPRNITLGSYKRSSGKQHTNTKWSIGSLFGFVGSKRSDRTSLSCPKMEVVEEGPES